jgi:membrane-associated phospholipid phosphatase
MMSERIMYAETIVQSNWESFIVILYRMLNMFDQIDTSLFFLLNGVCRNRLLDDLMPFVTGNMFILAAPVFILLSIKEKERAFLILAIALFSVFLADGVSNGLKHLIARERPCNVYDHVHLLVGCTRSYSMPSGHAANAFAFSAPFLVMTNSRLKYYFLSIAILVSLSRICVGVHYPGDVLVGALIGSSIALLAVSILKGSEKRCRERPFTSILIFSLLVLSLFRVFYILFGPLDLSPDEAHYWEWSRRLELSYYSKGPMIAYLIALSTALFGDTVFGVRVFAVLFSALTSLMLYKLGKDLYNEKVGVSSALLFQVIPLYATFGVVFTIDSPFIFFWALSLYLFTSALERRGRMDWLLLGISIGLGLLTKYTMALFFLCTLLFLLFSPSHRRHVRTAGPYLSFLVSSILMFSPVIIWNMRHDWVTFKHTAGQAHLAEGLRISLQSFFNFTGSQFGVVSPILLLLIMTALWKTYRIKEEFPSQREGISIQSGKFLFWFSVPVILFFTLKSLHAKVQANWAMMGYMTGLIAFSEVYVRRWQAHTGYTKAFIIAGLFLSLAITAVGHYPSFFHIPQKFDPSARLRGWKGLGREVSAVRCEIAKEGNFFIFSDSYQAASELAFYTDGHPVTYCVNLGRRMNQYDLWPDFNSLINSNAIFVTIHDRELPLKIRDAFEGCEKRIFRALEGKHVLREYTIFTCRGFKGMKQEETGQF